MKATPPPIRAQAKPSTDWGGARTRRERAQRAQAGYDARRNFNAPQVECPPSTRARPEHACRVYVGSGGRGILVGEQEEQLELELMRP